MVPKLLALVLPLGLDSFALCAALGMLGLPPARMARISILFTAFEAGMPLIGLLIGAPLGHVAGSAATYLAIAVLISFGAYTWLKKDEDDDARLVALAHVRGRAALLLGLSISVDELAIGFSLGLLGLPVGLVIAAIAVQTLVFTQAGLRLGNRVSGRMREAAERLAGVALTALGIVLLAEKLLGS